MEICISIRLMGHVWSKPSDVTLQKTMKYMKVHSIWVCGFVCGIVASRTHLFCAHFNSLGGSSSLNHKVHQQGN
jgi:hypothetical protein